MGICLYSVIYDRLLACLKEYDSIQLFSVLFVIVFYSSMLNLLIQLALLLYFVLYPVCITSPPQEPIIRSSAAQRTEGRFVPILGSTPRAATTLLGSYPRAQLHEVEATRISRQSALEGRKVASLTHQPPLPSRRYPWYLFPLETQSNPVTTFCWKD